MSTPRFDALRLLRVLDGHRVRLLVIGGFAARLHGSPTVTNDLDVCYAGDRANLHALAAALAELRARLRGAPPDAPFRLDAATLRAGDRFTFLTSAGSLDILGAPEGTAGFDELARAGTTMDLGGLVVRVAALDDLIRMKRAAGRPKDLIELEVLGALREEIDARSAHERRARRARSKPRH
jgi:hypothetical protein